MLEKANLASKSCCVVLWYGTNVSEYHADSIFREDLDLNLHHSENIKHGVVANMWTRSNRTRKWGFIGWGTRWLTSKTGGRGANVRVSLSRFLPYVLFPFLDLSVCLSPFLPLLPPSLRTNTLARWATSPPTDPHSYRVFRKISNNFLGYRSIWYMNESRLSWAVCVHVVFIWTHVQYENLRPRWALL
jgi:hypothetical protein